MTLWKHFQESLFKIHEPTQIKQKYLILLGLFVKVIIFQLLWEYRRASAFNFDKYSVIKTSERTLLKIHEITRIQQGNMILRRLFVKVIVFQLLRKYRRATAVNLDKNAVIKIFVRTSTQNSWKNTNSTKKVRFWEYSLEK